MEYIVIPDTAIWAVNRGKQENESSNIMYLRKCVWETYSVITC